MKNKSSQPISFNPTIIFDGKIIGRYDQKLKVVYFGTKYGDLQVNLKNSETTTQDIQNWIIKNNLQSAPSHEAWKKVLDRMEKQFDKNNSKNT